MLKIFSKPIVIHTIVKVKAENIHDADRIFEETDLLNRRNKKLFFYNGDIRDEEDWKRED